MSKIPKFQWGNTLNINEYTNFLNKGLNSSQKWYNNDIKNRFNLGDTTQSPLNSPYKFDPANLLKSNKSFSNSFTGSTDWLNKANITKGANIASKAFDLVDSVAPKLDNPTAANTILDVGSKIAGIIPGPWGQGISAGLKAINLIDKFTGKKSISQATQGASATGYNLEFNPSAGTSYGGLFGNKKRKQANRLSSRQDSSNITKMYASDKASKDLLASSNSVQDIYNKNYQKLSGGINTNVLSSKRGGVLEPNLKKIIQKAKDEIKLNKTSSFQEGGLFNVIPSGALHKELNHLDGEHTKKGIPVILDQGGEIKQQAEIEREEIIFNKEVTDKLESLFKKYNNGDESSAIEAGKLLTFEILENTKDNVNLIKKID